MLQPGLRCGTCAACAPVATTSARRYDVLGLRSDGGYAELISVPVREPGSDSRPHRLRHRRRVSPDVSDRLAHAGHPRAAAARARPCSCWPAAAASARPRFRSRAIVGARVLATSAPAKIDRTRALGADEVLDHYASDFSKEVRRLTNGRGVDVVVEHVGAGDVGPQRPCARQRRTPGHLRRDDRAPGRHRPPAPVRAAALAARLLHGPLCRAARGGRAVVRRHLPARHRHRRAAGGAAEAQRALEDRSQFGKIVLGSDAMAGGTGLSLPRPSHRHLGVHWLSL